MAGTAQLAGRAQLRTRDSAPTKWKERIDSPEHHLASTYELALSINFIITNKKH